nr:unnamed protein product [Callosobruchus analis]
MIESNMKFNISTSDIQLCYRIGKTNETKPRGIYLKLNSEEIRNKIYNKKLVKGTGLVIREDISSLRVELFNLAVRKFGLKQESSLRFDFIYLFHYITMLEFMEILDENQAIETEICDNFQEYFFRKVDEDIIALSETRPLDCLDEFTIPNYTQYYNGSSINKCDGGVLYIKNHISADVKVIPIGNTNFLRVTYSTKILKQNIKMGLL